MKSRLRYSTTDRCDETLLYIDDIVEGVMQVAEHPTVEGRPYRIYNIGNSAPVELMHFISVIEQVTGRKAVKEMLEIATRRCGVYRC